MLTIYDTLGAIRFQTPINKGSKRVFKLMSDDYITLHFSVANPIYFKLGDYCDVPNFGRFELVELYQPSYNTNTGGYDYELKLESPHMKWRNKIMRYLPNYGGAECAFVLTATADVHMEQVLANVNALSTEILSDGAKVIHQNYLYNGQKKYEVLIQDSVDASAKTINYDSTNIIDALTAIAEAYDCEWWMNGNIICLGKCEETNDYIDLELGVNVAEMSRSDSSENYVSRILAFGSERNISPRYRKDLIFDVKEVANGGNRISDTSRPLDGEWFSGVTTEVSASDKLTASFAASAGAKSVSSNSASDVLFYSETKTFNNVKAGEWKLNLSIFKPAASFYNRTGSFCEFIAKLSVLGTPDSGNAVNTEYPQTIYIPALGQQRDISFGKDQTITFPTEMKSVTITLNLYVKFQNAASCQAQFHASSTPLTLTNVYPNTRIKGINLQIIDENGNVTQTITGATYNPDYSEVLSERNWIQLPGGATMSAGQRFRITNIIKSKVKSSYFSSRYSAYAGMSNVVTNGIVTSRLMIPESYGTPYVDQRLGMTMEEGVEDVVVFEDEYPHVVCAITKVDTVERKETVENDDGSQSNTTFTAFKIKDDFFTSAHKFENDYILPNETLKITFQDGKRYEEGDTIPSGKKVGDLINPNSGKLNGWTFEVQFTKDTDGSAIWEIVRNNDSFVPNDILRPEIGDQFVLEGCDIAIVDDLFVEESEKRLLERAQKYLEKLNSDPSTYDCTMMPDVMKAGLTLGLGKRVNLINEAYIQTSEDANGRRWGRKSRVIGFEISLDIPYDNPVYTIGEKAAYSRFGEIEDKIDALKFSMVNGKSYSASTSTTSQTSNTSGGVYVIGQTDITPASETNVFSALRSMLEFCSKKASETINYLWSFTQGLRIGNYVLHNDGAKIDPNGDAEFNEVDIRKGVTVGGDANIDGSVNIGDELSVKNGVTIGDGYMPGAYGGRIWQDADGKVHIETDYLEAREKIEAKEVEIQEETHVGGCQIISPAAMRCSRVLPIYNDANSVIAYKCFFTAEDEDGTQIYNQFDVGDLAKCETFNLVKQANGKVGNHYFWRKVIEVGYVEKGDADYDDEFGKEGYIVLSNIAKEKDSASDVPLAGDRIITVGNDDPKKADRSNLIILASYGTGSPYIYQYKGINTFALTKDNLKVAISPNGNLFTGKFIVENSGTETDIIDYIDNNIYLEAYQLVLSNEMAGVPCDVDGNVIGDLPSSKITIYKGKTVETGWTLTSEAVGCTAAIVGNGLYLSALTDKNATVTVTATKKDCPTLTKVMTICKLKEGETGLSGDHAVQFEIEPTVPTVLVDMDNNCDPTELGCKVYMVIGNQNRVEVPLANTTALTTYTAGEKLLFFNGKLFVNRPVEVDVPTDLVLRYVIVNQDYKTGEDGKITPVITSESEHIYTGTPITTASRMKHVIFKLYRGTTLVDMQTVIVTTDATAMKITYNTRFEVNEKEIAAHADRIEENKAAINKAVTDFQITADGISANVSKQMGIIKDIINGAGRNLLLESAKEGVWRYSSDSMSNAGGYSEGIDSIKTCFYISSRSDATYEIFYYPIRPELIKEGEKYTFSAIVKLNATLGPIAFYAQIANTNSTGALTNTCYPNATDISSEISTVNIGQGTWKIQGTMTASTTGNKNGSQVLILGIVPAYRNKWLDIQLWHTKLEKGETATAWAEAPEDYSDYLYELLNAKIELTASHLTSQFTQLIGESEDRITGAYTSKITQTAREIRSEIEALDDELGAFKSEIRQTATQISLKVDELAGYENLVSENSTGKGWQRSNSDGEFEAVTPSNGVYALSNSSTSPRYLRTSRFSLKPSTKYTLSFQRGSIQSSISKGEKACIKYGDTASTLASMTMGAGVITLLGAPIPAGREKFTFTTGSNVIENAFVEFQQLGVKDGVAQGININISEVILEIGEVAHPYVDDCTGLLATGIDIYNKKIVFTSDNIIFQNNKGQRSMFIDENGKIYADYIDAEKLIVRRLIAGEENGERVEIDPSERAMAIYNKQGELCSTFNGRSYERGIAGIFSDAKDGAVDMYSNLYDGSNRMQSGQVTLSAPSNDTEAKKTYNLYSSIFPSDSPLSSPLSVIFSQGTLYCYCYSAGYQVVRQSGIGNTDAFTEYEDWKESHKSAAEANISLYLEVAEDAAFTKIIGTYYIGGHQAMACSSWNDAEPWGDGIWWHKSDSTYPSSTTTQIATKSTKATRAGYCRVRMEIRLSCKMSGSYATVKWGSAATNGYNLQANWKSEFYVSNFFANGFCLGIRKDKYVIAYKDQYDNMHFEVEEEKYGLKVNDTGIQYKHHGGTWMNMPLLVWKANLYNYASNGETKYGVKDQVGFNSYYPTVSRVVPSDNKSHIHIVITFPANWSVLSLYSSNTIVHLTGYGDNLMKGTLVSITSTQMIVEISDDATANDGSLNIELYKI